MKVSVVRSLLSALAILSSPVSVPASGGTSTHFLLDITAHSNTSDFPDFGVVGYPGGIEGGSNSDLHRMLVYADRPDLTDQFVWSKTVAPNGTVSSAAVVFSLEEAFDAHNDAANEGDAYFLPKMEVVKVFSTSDGTPMVAISWGSDTPSGEFRAVYVYRYDGSSTWTNVLKLEDRDYLDTGCTNCGSCGELGAGATARDILTDGDFNASMYPHGEGISQQKGYVLFLRGSRCDVGCSSAGTAGRHDAVLRYTGTGASEGLVEVNSCVLTEIFDLSFDDYSSLAGPHSTAFYDLDEGVARLILNYQEGIYSRVASVDQSGSSDLLHTRKGGSPSDFATVQGAGSASDAFVLMGRPSWSDVKSYSFSNSTAYDLTLNTGGQYANPSDTVKRAGMSFLPGGRPLLSLHSYNNQNVQFYHPLDLTDSEPVASGRKDVNGQTLWSSDLQSTKLNGVSSPNTWLGLTANRVSQHYCSQNGWTLVGTPMYGDAYGDQTKHVLLTAVRGLSSWSTYTDSTPTNLTISGSGPQLATEVFNNGSEFQVPTDPESLFKVAFALDPGTGMDGSEGVRVGVIEPSSVNYRRSTYTDFMNLPGVFGTGSTTHDFFFAGLPASNAVLPGVNFYHTNPSSSRTLGVQSVLVSRVGPILEDSQSYLWSFNSTGDVYEGSGSYNPATQWRVPYSTGAGLHQYFAGQPTEPVYGHCESGSARMGIDTNGICAMESPQITLSSGAAYRVSIRSKWVHAESHTPSTTPRLRLRLGNFSSYIASDELAEEQNSTTSGNDWTTKTFFFTVPASQGSSTSRLYIDMIDPRSADSTYAVQWKLYVDECRIAKIDQSP